MTKEIEIRQLKLGYSIPYEWKSKNLGVAEFTICPVFKRGYIRELYIDPLQQEQYKGVYFNMDLRGINFNKVWYSSPMDKQPKIWHSSWCKEHKCYSLRLYVPDDSSKLIVEAHFGDTIEISFK